MNRRQLLRFENPLFSIEHNTTANRKYTRRTVVAGLGAAAGSLLLSGMASADSSYEYKLGFKMLHELLSSNGIDTGMPLENEWHESATGNGRQRATNGELVWDKATNTMRYTDGYRTFVYGSYGLQERLNTEVFRWEASPNTPPTSASEKLVYATGGGYMPQIRVSSPPPDLGLDPFYTKYLDADGIPIVSSERVKDDALHHVRDTINNMLWTRPDVRDALVNMKTRDIYDPVRKEIHRLKSPIIKGLRVVVMADSEVGSDLPEWSYFTEEKKRERDKMRSLYDPLLHIVTVDEGDVRCNRIDKGSLWSGFAVPHEIAHAMQPIFNKVIRPDFYDDLRQAYREAMDKDLWKRNRASENVSEYWASLVEYWFNIDLPGPLYALYEKTGDVREALKQFDPKGASLVAEVFGGNEWRDNVADCPVFREK